MLIRSRRGVSADGFVSTDEGLPVLVLMPGFRSGLSHGFPERLRSRGSDADVHLVELACEMGQAVLARSGIEDRRQHMLTSAASSAYADEHGTGGTRNRRRRREQ